MVTKDASRSISCPKCGYEFALTDAIMGPLRTEIQRELQRKYDETLVTEKKKLEQQALSKAKEEVATESQDLVSQLEDLKKKLKQTQNAELDLRKKKRELDNKLEQVDLELARKLDDEKVKMKAGLEKSYTLKMEQRDKLIEDLRKQLQEAERKASQGSQQAQGEALEQTLEGVLLKTFPDDLIEPVAKGKRGADVVQRVNARIGDCCGVIYWESKNTKAWSDSWVEKLKTNQREIKADIAVIASVVLPKDVHQFGEYQGVWVVDWTFASSLGCALRFTLMELNRVKVASQGKDQKIEMLYKYLVSGQFKQRVEAIVGAFTKMRGDLDLERQSMERIWNRREKQIEAAIKGTAGMLGDIEGIAGAYLPGIAILELPQAAG
jgi:hypothetical protein